MTTLIKQLQWVVTRPRKIILYSSKMEWFGSVCGVHSASFKNIQGRQNQLSVPQSSNEMRSKGMIRDQPGWIKRMHELLLTDVRLPLPVQGGARFDPSHLRSCSVEDLLSSVWEVARIDKQTNALLMELWRRMDSMDMEQIISVADIFFINNVRSSWYLGAMTAYWMEGMDCIELTSSQLTRLVFHAVDRHRSTPPSFFLALEDCIVRHFDFLSLNQLAVICHSFFTSQNRMRSMDLLDMISVKLIKDFDLLNNWYFPIFMKTMRYSNFIKISFYKDLGDLLVEKNYLERFRSLAQIMHIAHAYASVRISHPVLFSYILKTCCNSRYKFRIKDLSKLLWACGTLVTNNPKDSGAIRKILTYLEHNLSLEEAVSHPDNLVDLVNGLCFLNINCDSLVNMLFHPQSVNAVIGMGKGSNKLPQLNTIYHSLRIENPKYSGHQLDENPNYSGHQLDEESKNFIRSSLGSFRVEQDMSIRKGLKQAVDALKQMLGNDKVLCTILIPHLQSSDIVLIWDTLGSQFICPDEVDISTCSKNEHYIRLSLQILSNMQTTYDGKPLGMLHMKLRQLKILGYRPVVIDSDDAFNFVFSDTRKTQDFLQRLISHALGTDVAHVSSNNIES